ncbi:DNA breaking-rejoining enzyme [Exidia glandulosa HHB12029]|uniref:DNA breaking-rejoining enzyme n=1 Tax=Exidia glandulosa HHB12029 TaxID=1314781 RepID=A0A165NZ51_EXIGL|nr:DNA breaking-rejoining enzyme [Exidia glandulosa HHB12029]
MATRKVKFSTLKQYLTHVRSFAVDLGVSSGGFDEPILQRVLKGIKRVHGDPGRKPKQPITYDVLCELVHSLETWTDHGLKLRAIFCLAFSGFLRCGEFTVRKPSEFSRLYNLTRASVEFFPSIDDPTHLVLTLPRSKTDPFRQGTKILIAAVPDSATCPVTAMREYFDALPANADDPLFFDGDDYEAPLTRDWFLRELQDALIAAGFNPADFSGHSFRRGAATTAYTNGVPDADVQRLGRWVSDAYRLYIDEPAQRILALNARLHMVAPLGYAPDPPDLRVPWVA